MKTFEFTKAERKYIRDMYQEDYPEVKKITSADKLPAGMVCLFLENTEEAEANGEDWELDRTISGKFLRYYGLPRMTLKEFQKKHLKAIQKEQEK